MPDRAVPLSESEETLREELDRSREEVLRLRDLLISKDAEMGKLRGELVELRSHLRILHTAAAFASRVPGLRRMLAPLRRAAARLGRPSA